MTPRGVGANQNLIIEWFFKTKKIVFKENKNYMIKILLILWGFHDPERGLG